MQISQFGYFRLSLLKAKDKAILDRVPNLKPAVKYLAHASAAGDTSVTIHLYQLQEQHH